MKKLSVISLFAFYFLFLAHGMAQTISTIAGIYVASYSGDGGSATAAELNIPQGVTVSLSSDIYIADYGNRRIRKITTSTGIISTVAGNGYGGLSSYSGDGGPATDAELDDPTAISFDSSGNMYISDAGNNVIRKVTASTGIITTIVGNGYGSGGLGGYSGDGGQATNAELDKAGVPVFDVNGNMYFPDAANNVIRKVNASTGIITTIAGNGYGYAKPLGHYTGGYTGDGGPATNAELYLPTAIVLDDSANIYIADLLNNTVRKVIVSTGIITTVAGNHAMGGGYSGDGGQATNAELEPTYIILDASGNMCISNTNSVIRIVSKTTGIISTVAGCGIGGYSGNGGPATSAELSGPVGIAFDALGNMYIADQSNSVIRKVTYNFTGINEIEDEDQINVFPNPNNGTFNLYLSNNSEECKVEIYNILGEKIYTKTLPQIENYNTINLVNQPSGIYFYRVVKETGALVGSGKLIIEK